MIWARMIVAPWWVRWLVNAAMVAVALVAITGVTFPTSLTTTGWPWRLLAVLGFSLAAAAPMVRVQTSVQQSYAAALADLNVEQRAQILKSLRRGEIPADPRVLAAAVRVGTVSLAYRRRATRWQRATKWVMPVAYILLAAVDFALNIPRQGVLWLGFAVFFAALFGWRSHRSRGLPEHVQRLRAAAAEVPEAASAATETEDAVTLAPRRMKKSALLITVVAIGFGVAMYFWGVPRQTPDCRTADNAVNFIYAHQEMLDAGKITVGDPALSKYQDWSDQLQSYARQVSTADLSRHLHRIADLSVQVVALVRDTRKDPAASPPPDVIRDHQTAFRNAVDELVAEDNALVPICHRQK